MNRKTVLQGLVMTLSTLGVSAEAGTVTVDSICADEVWVREIGALPPKAPEALYYPFVADEGTGVSDVSGNGHNGTVAGCAWVNAGPYAGGAMFFDGASGSIDVGPTLDFPSWNQYSVSVWFLHNGGGDFEPGYGQKILDKTSWYHDWHLSLFPSSGGIGLSFYESGIGSGIGDGSANYMDSAWHHVVVTRDGITGYFWVDGVLKSSCANMFPVYSSSAVCIGNSFSGDYFQQKSWSGMLDEVRIFDRTLSSNEVSRLYTEGALLVTNTIINAVSVSTNLTVCGGLTVTGRVSFASGVYYSRPLGDLACGIYTNVP